MKIRNIFLKVFGALLGALVLYVASVGPVRGYFYYNWVVSNGRETRPEKSLIYRPLYWPITELEDRSEFVRTALESYTGVIFLAIYHTAEWQ